MRYFVRMVRQVCRLESEEEESASASATTEMRRVITPPATSPVVARSSRRRSSRSGTSTGSEPPSDDPPVFDDALPHAGMKQRDPRGTEPPPVPPPRRCVPPPGSGEVWQRQAVRPATVGVHRRVLVAAATDRGRSASPKSCPTSPLLDGGGMQRRAGVPPDGPGQSTVVGGRDVASSPSENDHDGAAAVAVMRAAGSAPRRTKLPLSPLVRMARDVS